MEKLNFQLSQDQEFMNADEIAQARDQILRSGDGNGELTRITFDEAYQLLFEYGVKFFESNGHPGDAEAYTQDLIIKTLPYLDGKKGHFWHIHHFRTRFFKRALVNKHNDIHNKQLQDQRRLASTIVQPPPFKEKDPPIDPRSDLSRLTPKEVELVQAINKGLNYSKAAALLGVLSVEAIKKRVQRIRKKLKNQTN
jgi:DNA-directed RNA polymerase specialized sigma24 family protein